MKLQFVSYDNIDIIKSNLKAGLIILSRIPLTGYRMNWETHCSPTPNLLKYLISALICLQINSFLQKLKMSNEFMETCVSCPILRLRTSVCGLVCALGLLGLCEIQMGH